MKTQDERRDGSHLSALLHQIYEAGVIPERWNDVVAAIARSLGADKGLLFTPYLAPQHGGMIFPHGISEETLQLWASSYIEHDIWAESARSKGMVGDGLVFIDEEITPREQLLDSRFYREFLSHIGIGRLCFGIVFGGDPGLALTALSIYRDVSDPPFSAADKEWMQLLVSHVSRSLAIMQRLDTARLQNASLLTSFDRLQFGVALLDSEMCVLHLNAAAMSAMERRDGLSISSSGYLEGRTTISGTPSLSRWLLDNRKMPESSQTHFLDGCQIRRTDADSRYVIQCAPVSDSSGWRAHEQAVCYVAFITDPAALRLPEESRLMALYGLTPAQTRVALGIASGGTPRETAERMGISEETVRSHLKAIFMKTQSSRQSDLVRLVLSLGQAVV